jgi:hypothetical protein
MVGQLQKNSSNVIRLFRSPTLETVRMVELCVKTCSPARKTRIWEKLPRQIMWQTYLTVLDYLEEINKIATSDDGLITYIWNPGLAKKVRARKSY